MGKTRDLFKKIRDTKETFHAKTGSIKDRNGMDLTEAEDIKKRWQEYTEELHKKDLHDPDNHDGVITHLELDILESKVRWALESITTKKASGGDGIPVELFQILKDDAVKVLHSIRQQIWKTQQWPQDWKRSVFIPITKKGNAKECSNYHTIAFISHISKVMLKILQASLQQYMNCELSDVQAGFRKGRGTRDQIANICYITEKGRVPEKYLFQLYSNPKEWQCQRVFKLHTIALISHASKVMFKILQARLQQYVNQELPDVQAGLEKSKELEIILPTSIGSQEKQEKSRKTSTSASLTMPKPLTVWITINCGKF